MESSIVINEREEDNIQKNIKISIPTYLYKKIKAVGVLLDDNKNEAILFGNAIEKMYELSKDEIYKKFV